MASRRTFAVGGVLVGLLAAALVVAFLRAGRTTNGRPNVSPSPSVSETPMPTDVRTQVEQAYLKFWEVWAAANLELDPARMEQVAAGEALTVLREQVEGQRSKNQPVRIRVEHDYEILLPSEETASVEDRYVNHSVRLDPVTKQPIEPEPNQTVRKSYTLKKVAGQWKVFEIIELR